MAACKARRSLVQKIRAIAKRHNVPVVPDTASAARVEAMYYQVLECAGLAKRERALAEDAFAEYATLKQGPPGRRDARATWKFKAAQLVYNATTGDWASDDKDVLQALFGRLVAFFKSMVEKLHIVGLTVALEESLKAGEHVHAHVYIHTDQPYRRGGAPSDFTFEGIKPHVEPNTASGGAYAGAVNHGHSYALVDKTGSLLT